MILTAEDLKHLQRIRRTYSKGSNSVYWAVSVAIDTILRVESEYVIAGAQRVINAAHKESICEQR